VAEKPSVNFFIIFVNEILKCLSASSLLKLCHWCFS